MEIINIILEVLGGASIITAILGFIMKLIPNERLYNIGWKLGHTATLWGSGRIPGYEKLEAFLQNSFGQFFKGVNKGLNSDEQTPVEPPKKPEARI
jgi:hypothetical protein